MVFPKAYSASKRRTYHCKVLHAHLGPRLGEVAAVIMEAFVPGGLPQGTSIVLVGPPGTGKTCFCLRLVAEALHSGHDALYLSTENTPSTIAAHARDLHLLSSSTSGKAKLQFVDAYSWRIGMRRDPLTAAAVSNPGNLNEVSLILTDHARTLALGSVVVIDSLSGLCLTTPEEERVRMFVHILGQRISAANKRVVFVLEQNAHEDKLVVSLRALVHGTFFTKTSEDADGRLHWFVRAYSLVGATTRTEWFELTVGRQGLQLARGGPHE
jgi:KaiC/GvpD/RAD55 family RecA-like ATPase